MTLAVIPDYLADAITEKVDAIIAKHPKLEPDKEEIRANIVHYALEGYALDAIQIEPTNDD